MATLRSCLPSSLAPISALLFPRLAHACTVCDSPTGHQVRAGLFNGHFLHTLSLVLLPFPVLAAAVVLVAVGMPEIPEGRAPMTDAEPAGDCTPTAPALQAAELTA